VLTHSIPYQSGAILFRSSRGLIGSAQELLIENDLHGQHIYVESVPQYIPHPEIATRKIPGWRSVGLRLRREGRDFHRFAPEALRLPWLVKHVESDKSMA
jgi:hypothetical protein